MISKESWLIYFSLFATFLVWPLWLVNLEIYKTICFTVDCLKPQRKQTTQINEIHYVIFV